MSQSWRNVTGNARHKLTAQARRENGFDDAMNGRPAASLELHYQYGFRLGFRYRRQMRDRDLLLNDLDE